MVAGLEKILVLKEKNIPVQNKARGEEYSPLSFLKNYPQWKRNLIFLWIAQMIAMIGMSAFLPFIPLYVREHLNITSPAEVHKWSGLLYAAPFMLSVFATPVWGALGDRFGRKPMVVRAVLGLAVTVGLMGLAQDVWQLFLLRILQGGVSGFIAANLSFVSSETPEEHSGYALGILQTATSAGMVAGPLLGGIFSDTLGMRNVFFAIGSLCLISGLIVLFFVREQTNDLKKNSHSSVKENFSFAANNSLLRLPLLIIILAQASIVFVGPIFALYLEELHTPPQYLKTITGVMVGIVGLCSVIFAPMWGRKNDSVGLKKTLLIASLAVALSIILQGLVPRYEFLLPLRILSGIFVAAIIPSLYSVLSKNSPSQIRGGIMGLASSATLLGNLISPTLSGWIASHIGMRWCFFVSGAMMFGVYQLSRILVAEQERKTFEAELQPSTELS